MARLMILALSLGLTPCIFSQDGKPAESNAPAPVKESPTVLFYVRFELDGHRTSKTFLHRVTLDGKELGNNPLPEPAYRIRATRNRTVLVSQPVGFAEYDAEGKVVFEATPFKGQAVSSLSATPMPNGDVLTACFKDSKLFVAQIDRKGAIARKVELDVDKDSRGQTNAWVTGEDKFLISNLTGVAEYDWTGKKLFEHNFDAGTTCTDAVPLPSGNIACVLRMTQNGKKAGKAVEIDRQGKELWSGSHSCGLSVQPLANGNFLVGGG